MICVPIVSQSMRQALDDISAAEPVADIIELRVDLIPDADIPQLLKAATKPCIVTNRTKREGGQFKGTEEERVDILRRAIDGGAEYIDIEASTPKELLKSILNSKGNSQAILSYHNFTHTLDDLIPLYEVMCELSGDVVKIVTYAEDINDNLKIFEILTRARRDQKKLIALCMGEKGEISRILTTPMGGFLTFGSLETGKESAPGQITAAALKNIYRVGLAREQFNIYGVIGNPVAKSMGYLIHNRAFQETGSPDIYVPFLVTNAAKFFRAFDAYFNGLSITMPFKEDISPLLEEVDGTAGEIGAINTVVREDGRWKGYNTDCTGALQALEERIDLKGKKVLIIGSGGTAKAIGYGVASRGCQLTVSYHSNRERGQKLAEELKCDVIAVQDAGDHPADVLINCSPVGMSPRVGETPLPAGYLKEGMVVFDSVYNPPETRLLREAKAAGCTVISGVELFLNQAAAQFELWTGEKAPVPAMREVLMERLRAVE
ncbi:MAG: shikimate dehydrogenase [Nitrospinaceae bacterium]